MSQEKTYGRKGHKANLKDAAEATPSYQAPRSYKGVMDKPTRRPFD